MAIEKANVKEHNKFSIGRVRSCHSDERYLS